MKNQKVLKLFKQAEEELNKARQELYHPAEDVVNYSACVFSRHASYRFMEGLYLLYTEENNDIPQEGLTLEELVEYCRKYDEQLDALDFTSLNCKTKDLSKDDDEDIFYCNDVNVVNGCTELAKKIREVVIEKAGDEIFQDA